MAKPRTLVIEVEYSGNPKAMDAFRDRLGDALDAAFEDATGSPGLVSACSMFREFERRL